jgi:hypothetical protein
MVRTEFGLEIRDLVWILEIWFGNQGFGWEIGYMTDYLLPGSYNLISVDWSGLAQSPW